MKILKNLFEAEGITYAFDLELKKFFKTDRP